MRRLPFLILFISLAFYACENNVEQPGFDCSASDLSIEVVSSTKSDCQVPGSIKVKASGGDGFYSFSQDGENFQSDSTFNDLFAGNFTLQVKDGAGCVASVDFILESEPTGITLTVESTISDCADPTGTVTANATGGTGDLSFSLDDGDFGTENVFQSVGAGEHTITTKDEEGCEVVKSVFVNTSTSLKDDIMPIIRKDCAISSCHNGSRSPTLTTTSAVIQNAGRIRSETQSGSMPRNRTLTRSEIDLIACWVDDGAKDN